MNSLDFYSDHLNSLHNTKQDFEPFIWPIHTGKYVFYDKMPPGCVHTAKILSFFKSQNQSQSHSFWQLDIEIHLSNTSLVWKLDDLWCSLIVNLRLKFFPLLLIGRIISNQNSIVKYGKFFKKRTVFQWFLNIYSITYQV